MRIQLYDRGTAQGKQLFAALDDLAQRMQLDCVPEYIKDMSRVYSQGITGETILMVNGEVAIVDRYPSAKELEIIINDFI